MNAQETTQLLARVQVLDNRQVDALTIEAWGPLMAGLDYGEAVDAVNQHFRSSTEYLKPANIVRLVKAARRDAAERRALEGPGEDATGKPVWFDAAVKASAAATRRCMERGYGRSDQVTVRSAQEAAENVRLRFEVRGAVA